MNQKKSSGTTTFPLEGLPKSELLVSYNAKMSMTPSRIEECHGKHEFDDSDICVEVTRVEVVVFGRAIEITRQLTEKEIKKLSEQIAPIF